jgi:sugar/nucleoside kinase (ribokinase family)
LPTPYCLLANHFHGILSHMLDLLTVGDIKLDTFLLLPDASVMCGLRDSNCKLCVDYGKKIPVTTMLSQIAGTAPNVAIGVARFGKKTGVVSVMGDDDIYDHAKRFLKRHKVNTTHVSGKPGLHSSAATVVTYKGESTQFVDHVDVEYRLPDTVKQADWVHISELGEGYLDLYRDAIATKKHHGTKISFNPGAIQIEAGKSEFFDLLRSADVLFLNMREAKTVLKIEQEDDIRGILAGLRSMGPEVVVVTDGTKGAYAFDGETMTSAPMFPGKRIEATGAGDAFSSGFLGAMLSGLSHDEALQYASVNAASAVGAIGPTAGLLSAKEIESALRQNTSYRTASL